MQFSLEPHNGLPIYDQIVRHIKFAVARGSLREGELAPGVRELARELTINPNTVARAYQQLQYDDVLETARGTGLVVKKSAAARCRRERSDLIRQRLESVLREALASGIPVAELKQQVSQHLARLDEEAQNS